MFISYLYLFKRYIEILEFISNYMSMFLPKVSTYEGTGIQWKDNFESAFTEISEIGRWIIIFFLLLFI